MSNSVLLFLMGPPVSVPSEFAALIQPILQEFCQGNCRDIQIADISGPVHYLEDWMDVGSRTRRERRLGLRMVDLWALRITWTGSSMMHRSWTGARSGDECAEDFGRVERRCICNGVVCLGRFTALQAGLDYPRHALGTP